MFPVVVPSPRLPLNDLNIKIITMAMTIMMIIIDEDEVPCKERSFCFSLLADQIMRTDIAVVSLSGSNW